MSNPLLSLTNIAYTYDDGTCVLSDVNFAIHAGERAALTGRNGAGKTTLLHLMIGLLKPGAGTVEAFGKARVSEKDFYEVRCRAGLCFQMADHQLFCPTVAEDVAFGPLNLGKSHAETRQIVANVLELVGLEGFEQKITHHLSGGEKRLAALASVLAMEPDLLLLDEPTAELDERAKARLIKALNGLPQAKLIISHDRAFLNEVTDHHYELEEGQVRLI